MKLPAYPKYKPSGIEWLGGMPEHWELKRLKFVADTITSGVWGDDPDSENDGVRVATTANITRLGEIEVDGMNRRVLSSEERRKGKCEPGDTIVVKSSGSATNVISGKAGYVKREHGDLFFSNFTMRVRPRESEADARFMWYFLTSHVVQAQVRLMVSTTTYPNLQVPEYLSFVFAKAKIQEQHAIADYLDRETTKIDALVAKKRELIEKLKEKRTALISRTVTRGLPPDAARAAGLDPNPKLKPSGIDWIPDTPVSWETRRLRHISDGITVGVVVNPSSYVSDEGVPFLLGGDVKDFRIDTTACNRCRPEDSNGPLRKSRLTADDLVVVRVGYPGVASVVPPELEGANCASMMIVRRHPRFCSQWLAYTFNSQVGRDQIEIVQYGAAQKQFNISHAVDFAFPFPPLKEQKAIAYYLDRETAKLDALVETAESVIDRLQEYRTALITAAVTGKIDVRGATSGVAENAPSSTKLRVN